jgi:phage terminase large subunit GpA-like protein
LIPGGGYQESRNSDRTVAGFHIKAFYSLWRDNWLQLTQEWHEANKEDNPEKLNAIINLRLDETWEELGDAIEALALKARIEACQADVPDGVGLLTAAIDVQSDRLECVVKGWGDSGPGPGCIHLAEFAEDEYLAQFTSEKGSAGFAAESERCGTISRHARTWLHIA